MTIFYVLLAVVGVFFLTLVWSLCRIAALSDKKACKHLDKYQEGCYDTYV
jgi:hypothetical protein